MKMMPYDDAADVSGFGMPSQRMKMPRRVACRHYIVPMRQQECNEDIDLLHRKPTIAVWPSGKAWDFGSQIRRFESYHRCL